VDVNINFLKCFSCLEKLYIWVTILARGLSVYFTLTLFSLVTILVPKLGCHNFYVHFPLLRSVSTRILHTSLKKIVLINYHGNNPHIAFAKFFVLNARVLQSMGFYVAISVLPETNLLSLINSLFAHVMLQ
jgi:hypothetical protein